MDILEFHPHANLLPLIEGPEFDELVEDIRQNGVRQPIDIHEGKILDGRNRYRALFRLFETRAVRGAGWGVWEGAPIEEEELLPEHDVPWFKRYSQLESGNPLDYVISQNVKRRHLNEAQRSILAAKIANVRQGERTDLSAGAEEAPKVDQASAADMLNVSERSVRSAKTVVEQGEPELVAAVERGDAAVSVAEVIARQPKETQREILRQVAASPDGKAALKQAAKEVRAEDQRRSHVERQEQAEQRAERNPALPAGRTFSIVLIDVPRHHESYSDVTGSEKAPERHYNTMSFRQLLDFAINNFASPDAIIAYWTTPASLIDDIEILADWGFISLRPRGADGKLLRDEDGDPFPPVGGGKYGSHQIWNKIRTGDQQGMGRWFRDEHEMLIIARRGDVPAPLPGTQPGSAFEAEWKGHSVKPHDVVCAWISRCWPKLTKIEVFARGQFEAPKADGDWHRWGNEAVYVGMDLGAGDTGATAVVNTETGEITEIEYEAEGLNEGGSDAMTNRDAAGAPGSAEDPGQTIAATAPAASAPIAESEPDQTGLYSMAVNVVLAHRKPSPSLVSRMLGIGYAQAERLVESMEFEGLCTAPNLAGLRELTEKGIAAAPPDPLEIPPVLRRTEEPAL